MAVRQPRYSKEEFALRGDEIYESYVRSQVEEGNHGKIVAIDIETGIFEVADEILTATDRLFERLPDAQPWIIRIGHRAVHRFGARSLRKPV
jgi:peptide subunit release factor RF-3